jgi:ABC-type phosphate transport system permease subunit
MRITELEGRGNRGDNDKAQVKVAQFKSLIIALEKKELPDTIVAAINLEVQELNTTVGTDDDFSRSLKKKQSTIISLVEKQVKIVPQHYYRTMWMVLGMSVFGLPLGVAFGAILNNMGLLGLGLPIGMGIGILVGTRLDEKAKNENRQLSIEIK